MQLTYLETIRKEKLGWREIDAIVRGKADVLTDRVNSEVSGKDSEVETLTQQPSSELSPADPTPNQHVSTVETNDSTSEAEPTDVHPTRPSVPVRKQLQAAASIESQAAKLGLAIRKNTDLTVIKGVLSALADSSVLPKRIIKSLRSVDYENRDEVLHAWCGLADVFKEPS